MKTNTLFMLLAILFVFSSCTVEELESEPTALEKENSNISMSVIENMKELDSETHAGVE